MGLPPINANPCSNVELRNSCKCLLTKDAKMLPCQIHRNRKQSSASRSQFQPARSRSISLSTSGSQERTQLYTMFVMKKPNECRKVRLAKQTDPSVLYLLSPAPETPCEGREADSARMRSSPTITFQTQEHKNRTNRGRLPVSSAATSLNHKRPFTNVSTESQYPKRDAINVV